MDPLVAATEALVFATGALVAVGVVQLIVNAALWHATATQARVTHRQLLIANRPQVRFDWELLSGEQTGPHHLLGLMRETCGMPVVLHWATAWVSVPGAGPNRQTVNRHELDGDHVALVIEVLLERDCSVDVRVHACASTAAIPETVETWRQDISMRIEPGGRGVTVLWQSKSRIDPGEQRSSGQRLADALVRAWRGGA